jgi:DNA replication protein DnaC
MTEQNHGRDYMDEEGCLHCGVCGKRKELNVNLMGFHHKVSCLCDCEVSARKAEEDRRKREEAQNDLYRRKSVGLKDKRFWEWRFENDNCRNDKLVIARQYVENWEKMKKENVGILLMGPVGTGKSFFAGCIANALLEQGERVMMTNFSRILNELTNYKADKNQIVQNLVDYPLLIIDDLGIERHSEFALEQIYNVIDSRYCKMKPLIVTTNLGMNDMKAPGLDVAHQRIYSRIFEMCVPVYCGGADRRKEEGTEKLEKMKLLIHG